MVLYQSVNSALLFFGPAKAEVLCQTSTKYKCVTTYWCFPLLFAISKENLSKIKFESFSPD